MTIHDNLRQLRINCGLTQAQVAEKVGITRQALSSYESGRTRPDIDMLMRLAEIYKTDLDAILYGQERRLVAVRRVGSAGKVVFALTVTLTFISALLQWSINRFFPLPEGQVTEEELALLAGRVGLNHVWQIADGSVLAVAFLGAVVLLCLLITGRTMISLKTKLIYLAVLGAAMLAAAIPFGLLDPLYELRNYLFTPVTALLQMAIFLIADVVIEYFQRRKIR